MTPTAERRMACIMSAFAWASACLVALTVHEFGLALIFLGAAGVWLALAWRVR